MERIRDGTLVIRESSDIQFNIDLYYNNFVDFTP